MKYLPRTTVCTLFEIGSPIWNGGKRVVGLAEYRITKHNEITFGYVRKKDGKKSIPDHYYFDGDLKDNYPRDVQKGLKLVLVPFTDLEILTREQPVEWLTEKQVKEQHPNIYRIFFSEDKDSAQLKLL